MDRKAVEERKKNLLQSLAVFEALLKTERERLTKARAKLEDTIALNEILSKSIATMKGDETAIVSLKTYREVVEAAGYGTKALPKLREDVELLLLKEKHLLSEIESHKRIIATVEKQLAFEAEVIPFNGIDKGR